MPKPTPRRYRSGATHSYLGRQYRLRIVSDTKPGVSLKLGFIEIRQPDATDSNCARKQTSQWMRKQAERRFQNEFGKALKRLPIH